MKNKIGIIIQREYKTRVVKKSFLIFTLLIPILFVLVIALPILLAKFSDSNIKIGVIDKTGLYQNVLQSNEDYTFVKTDKSIEQFKSEAQNGKDHQYEAIVSINQDLLNNPNAITIYSYKTLPSGVKKYITELFNTYLTNQKIASYKDIPNLKEVLKSIDIHIHPNTYKWDKHGDTTKSSGTASSIIASGLTMLSYFFILMYGSMVLQGVIEEKKNRIMEVMVSTVKPFDMMMGKIIGIGLVGLTQILVWIVFSMLLLVIAEIGFLGNIYSLSTLQSMSMSGIHPNNISPDTLDGIGQVVSILQGINIGEILSMFILFFIGGYLLYSALFAAIGSSVSSSEDSAQQVAPVTILMMFAFYSGIASTNNPDSLFAFWCSIIPFTSPIVMMVRLPYSIPLWQEILSIVVLYGSFIGLTWLSGKIYRVGILMYGKKPSLKELWKWTKYK